MKSLYLVFILELFLGGGGRFTAFGSVSLRMLLFGVCTLFGFNLLRRNVDFGRLNLSIWLIAIFFLTNIHAVLIGILGGYKIESIVTEFQQAVFWVVAPYFEYHLRDQRVVKLTSVVLKLSGVVLGVIYLIIILLLQAGLLDFYHFYSVVSPTGEIFFRGDSLFFYKGFIYISLAIVFFAADKARFWSFWVCFLGFTLLLTLTRGLLISTSLSLILLAVAQRRWFLTLTAFGSITAIAFAVLIYIPGTDFELDIDRSASTDQRFDDMDFMIHNIQPTTILYGEGYGSFINERTAIENTFFWALWKLGVLGLMFWMMPLCLCAFYFVKVQGAEKYKLACAFFFGVVLVYIQTGTNPYLNNPIGLSYVIISIFSLKTLSRKEV
jgi:hypothetical protein